MYSRMLPTSLGKAVWIMNQDVLPQLLQMTLPVKNVAGTENVGGSRSASPTAQGTGTPQFTLLGRPVVLTEKVSTLGTWATSTLSTCPTTPSATASRCPR
jgi:HK97 family phage major capsid protein